ncbi:GAP family protein [Paeniglutamicibacter kerguelensis]|uniref:Threonine/homoserine/homoserine lactone efflux protein n=1 Tax=Paeniglutamicibacter kerguelensis TaxID=254788 RepID=A0ABS4XI04_9MICC|nr:GAP family protein [Paeniglutamicibacter kerguelensis]MBP2388108.1 threonine/homoserine/homoserine lactone efflux protein [Paeniglutamicibacter kerguelensis]
MVPVIGEILPLAVGIAISPLPVIAAILMLLSPKARVTSVGFLLGWVVGIIVAVTVFTLLSSILPEQDPEASKPVQGIIQLLLGAGLLLLAIGQWRKRPKPGEDPALPKWMQAIDKVTFITALGLGFLLSALNPKNLIMAAGAGLDIGSAELSTGAVVLVVAIFTVIAASTVMVPVLGYLIAAEKLRRPLDSLRTWLAKENALIMAILLLLIGVSMIGKGIGHF